MVLRVNVEHLLAVAAQVAAHGEDLADRYVTADNRLQSAVPGWAGRSAVALNNRAECWRRQATTLICRIGEHATDLHNSAIAFAAMEERHSAALSAPSAAGAPAAGR